MRAESDRQISHLALEVAFTCGEVPCRPRCKDVVFSSDWKRTLVSYQQIMGWRLCAPSRRWLVITIAFVILISASKLLNFGAIFFSDSLDYVNYAEFLRGKS